MRAWPLAFEFDPLLRQTFISACEAQEIYGIPREVWKPPDGVPRYYADYVWNTARELLNS